MISFHGEYGHKDDISVAFHGDFVGFHSTLLTCHGISIPFWTRPSVRTLPRPYPIAMKTSSAGSATWSNLSFTGGYIYIYISVVETVDDESSTVGASVIVSVIVVGRRFVQDLNTTQFVWPFFCWPWFVTAQKHF